MGAARRRVWRCHAGQWESEDDWVVEETPLTLFVNQQEVVTLLTVGEHPLELAVGFLRAEGFFSSLEEVHATRVEDGAVHLQLARAPDAVAALLEKRTLTSGCGKGVTFYNVLDGLRCHPVQGGPTLGPDVLLQRMKELQRRSGLYRKTGGTHNASLVDGDRTLCFRTDIGRHNAVDMLGGWCLLTRHDPSRAALLTTGRVSSEIVTKTAKMEIGLLVSRSAPTELALRLADEVGVTVVGYVRGDRLTVYTHPQRVAGAPCAAQEGAEDLDGHGNA